MGVHDIQGLFEAAILHKADDFTVKGRHVIFVFMQNYDRRDAQPEIKKATRVQGNSLKEVNLKNANLVPAEKATNSVRREVPREARDTSFIRVGRPISDDKL